MTGNPATPAPLQTKGFVRLLIHAGLIAIPVTLVAIGFVAGTHAVAHLIWHDLRDALGAGGSSWFVIAVPLAGGLLVGLAALRLPAGTGEPPQLGHALALADPPGDEHAARTRGQAAGGMVIAGAISLVAGASIGPEMPMLGAALIAAALVAPRLHWPAAEAPLVRSSAVAAVVGGIFGSPLAAAALIVEAVPLTGAALYRVLLPALVSGCIGAGLFGLIAGHAFAAYHLPGDGTSRLADWAWAPAIGVAGGLIGLGLMRLVDGAGAVADRLRSRPLVLGAAGGALLGLVAVIAGERTLFSGQAELGAVFDDAATITAGTLLVLAAGKCIAIVIAFRSGFRGGAVFPLVFVGGVLGLLAAQALPGLSEANGAAYGMVALAVAGLPYPIFCILFIGFFTAADLIAPLSLAAVAAYLVVHGRQDR